MQNIILKRDPVLSKYSRNNCWGIAVSIDLHGCNPKTIRSAPKIKKFVVDLCKLIEMKRFGECQVVNFGEDERVAGFSMTQLIETSLISGHFANQSNNVYLDAFSCKYFNPETVAKFASKFFGADNHKIHINLRK